MPPLERSCPDRRRPTGAGAVIDYWMSAVHPSEWVETPLETSGWTGKVKNEVRHAAISRRRVAP